MDYKIIISEYASQKLDQMFTYLIYEKRNRDAAQHLYSELNQVFETLRTNPGIFPVCEDYYLSRQGFHRALLKQMRYIVIYKFDKESVYVYGIFHFLENYQEKVSEL